MVTNTFVIPLIYRKSGYYMSKYSKCDSRIKCDAGMEDLVSSVLKFNVALVFEWKDQALPHVCTVKCVTVN